jgi:hypothetical protein
VCCLTGCCWLVGPAALYLNMRQVSNYTYLFTAARVKTCHQRFEKSDAFLPPSCAVLLLSSCHIGLVFL